MNRRKTFLGPIVATALVLGLLAVSGCDVLGGRPSPTPTATSTKTPWVMAVRNTYTPVPTPSPPSTAVPMIMPMPTSTPSPTVSPSPTRRPQPTKVPTPLPTPTSVPVPQILLQDSFDADANRWQPFLNYHRLKATQWYWEDGVGRSSGAYSHNRYRAPGKEADDALTMYLGPGSESWTNYRFEAWVYAREDMEKAGLWFRGHYKDDDTSGKWVLGYYYFIQPGQKNVYAEIWQNETQNDCESVCNESRWWNTFNTLRRLEKTKCTMLTSEWYNQWHKLAVEVRGNNIKAYLDDQLEIDFTDTQGDILLNGTVGLACYKAALLRYDDVLVKELP